MPDAMASSAWYFSGYSGQRYDLNEYQRVLAARGARSTDSERGADQPDELERMRMAKIGGVIRAPLREETFSRRT